MQKSEATLPGSYPARIPGLRVAGAGLRTTFKHYRPWLSCLGILLIWYGLTALELVNTRAFPGPAQIAVTAWNLTLDGTLAEAVSTSLMRVIAGASAGVALGLALGLVAGFSSLGEDLVDKPMQMLRTIPFTALVPLLILWFGIDETPKIILVALGVMVPVYINTFGGIRNVDMKLVEVARIARMNRLQIATRILLPAALPNILIGLRFALGLGWIAVIVAETVGANSGIGFLLTSARQFVRADIMLVCVCLYATLGLATDYLVRRLEHKLLVWRVAYTG